MPKAFHATCHPIGQAMTGVELAAFRENRMDIPENTAIPAV